MPDSLNIKASVHAVAVSDDVFVNSETTQNLTRDPAEADVNNAVKIVTERFVKNYGAKPASVTVWITYAAEPVAII